MKTDTANLLTPELLRKIDAYWRAANYLSVGQIYLYDNPLLKRPLALADVKHMLLGHWGTTPGQNFIYAHLNRIIKKYDLNMIYVSGPGHGGPAVVGNTYLEGTYSEIYPNVSQDEAGLRNLFRSFRFPEEFPAMPRRSARVQSTRAASWVTRSATAFGAVFDNPDLVVACVVGDGEAETGPLATAWHSNKFLDPATRRRGTAHSPPERLQDFQPDAAGADHSRRIGSVAPRLRLDALLRRRSRTRADASKPWRRRSTR